MADIQAVWKQVTPELEAELADFWVENKAIADRQSAVQRAKQAVCIARSPEGRIVGVSTVQPRIVPRLRQPMYYYRNFVAADWRRKGLAEPFLNTTKKVLQDYNRSLPRPVCLGVIIELENTSLAQHRNEAVWKEVDFTFIGYSPKGLHLRVWYFDDARLMQPQALRQTPRRARVAAN